jgi:glycosyltransferase involved in cell wall biosynthesis
VQRISHSALFKSGAAITGFDGRENEYLFMSHAYDPFWLSNRETVGLENFEAFLRQVEPDAIHFHHLVDLGLEFLTAARRHLDRVGGPLVLTLHDFSALCMADGRMLRTFNGSLCEHASPVRCNRCFPSFAPEQFSMRRMWVGHHLDMVDLFVAPSRQIRRIYEAWGLPAGKIVDIPDGRARPSSETAIPALGPSRRRDRFTFIGHPDEAAGFPVLLDAVRLLRNRPVGEFTLTIASWGSVARSGGTPKPWKALPTEEMAATSGGIPRVRLIESCEPSDVARLMASTDWVVVPTVWRESAPETLLDAFLHGRPVICSDIDVMREMVRHGVDGLHFVTGCADSLADAMDLALNDQGLWERLHGNIAPPPAIDVVAQQHLGQCYGGERARAIRRRHPDDL